jgi:hypothetical protein
LHNFDERTTPTKTKIKNKLIQSNKKKNIRSVPIQLKYINRKRGNKIIFWFNNFIINKFNHNLLISNNQLSFIIYSLLFILLLVNIKEEKICCFHSAQLFFIFCDVNLVKMNNSADTK